MVEVTQEVAKVGHKVRAGKEWAAYDQACVDCYTAVAALTQGDKP